MKTRKNLNVWLAMSIFLLLMVSTAAGGTIYVDADAGGANNGSSWTNAYRYLQDGLAAAAQLGSLKDRRNSVLRSITTKDETAKRKLNVSDKFLDIHVGYRKIAMLLQWRWVHPPSRSGSLYSCS